jgi:hypothetical protein
VSKEQREAYAEQGTSTPVAESVQVSGGVEDTPENQEARAEAANEVRFAASAQRDLNVKQLENRSAAAKVEGMQLQEELRDRRTVQTFAKKRVDNMAQMSESAAEAYREHSLKPDPKSPMADIGLALMQAFGAYGASLGGTENFAARIVENAVQREVAQKRLEHEQLGEEADNAYSRYVKAIGDADIAEDVYRDTQKRFALIQAERTAAEMGVAQEDVNLQKFMASFEQQRQSEEAAWREKAQGKVTRSIQSQVLYPQAASGGGRRPMTLKERAQASTHETTIAENRAKQETARRTVEAGGKTPGELSTEDVAQAKREERYVEGYGPAATREEAIRVREVKAAAQSYRNNLEEAKKLASSVKAHVPGTKEYEKYKITRDNIKLFLARRGGGIVTESDYAIADVTSPKQGVAAGAAEIIADQSTNRIDALLDQTDNVERQMIREAIQGQHPDVPVRGASEE